MASRKILCIVVLCALNLLIGTVKSSGKELEALLDITSFFFQQDGCPVPENSECPNSNISYYLYTRDTQNSPHQLDPSKPETIQNARFVEGVPLKVIIHGYTGHKDSAPNVQLRPAYFKHGEYNILTVDWGKLAPVPCYYEAAMNVDLVSKCAAKLLDMILEIRSDVTLANTHILGFSLGAHIAGLMAANLSTGVVPRVSGFDPALPLFDQAYKAESEMIRADVADFVDIYHSNNGLQGKRAPCGGADIFFNNGTSQPGCNCSGTCDHLRAVEYFAESINSENKLWGLRCDSWSSYINNLCVVNSTASLVELGEFISSESGGTFVALTNSESPFLLAPSAYIDDSELQSKVSVECGLDQYFSD